MTRINLLPWREALRKERKRQFTSIVAGAALLMLAVIFYAHIHMGGLIDHQNGRNAFLEQEIAVVEKKIVEIKELESQKKQLLNRMTVIQDLQTRRPMVVHLLDKLVRAMPEGLYLSRLSQKGTQLTLEGTAQSNARVSAFMRKLDASDWFSNPQLDVIQMQGRDGTRASGFTLKVTQLSPEEVEAKKAGKTQ